MSDGIASRDRQGAGEHAGTAAGTVESHGGDEPLVDDHNSLLPPDAFHLPVGRPVTHKVFRDAAHPSRLVLPFTTTGRE